MVAVRFGLGWSLMMLSRKALLASQVVIAKRETISSEVEKRKVGGGTVVVSDTRPRAWRNWASIGSLSQLWELLLSGTWKLYHATSYSDVKGMP